MMAITTAAGLAMTGVARADGLQADADSLASGTGDHGNSMSANQAEGTTVAYDLSALIEDTGNANNDVFPTTSNQTVSVTIVRAGSWLSSSTGSPDSWTFSSYGVSQNGQIRVSVPACTPVGTTQTMTATLSATASNGERLNPDLKTLTYEITASAGSSSCGGSSPSAPAAPVVDAGGPYSGSEGAAIAVDGAGFTDADSTTHTVAWTIDSSAVGSAGTCALANQASLTLATITCTDNGTATVKLTVTDDSATPLSGSDTASVTITNAAPIVGTVAANPTAACSVSVTSTYTDAGSADTHTTSIDWGDDTATASPVASNGTTAATPHTYTSAGTKTITVTVTDDDSGVGSKTASFATMNTAGAFLAPINTGAGTPRSVFKLGSTIPVKITVTDCGGNLVTSLAPSVQLQKVDNTADGSVNEPQIVETPTNGKAMKWDGTQYHYNLSTKKSQFCANPAIQGCTGGDLTAGSYQLAVTNSTFFAPALAYFDLR